MHCSIPDCFSPATVDAAGMPVCRACDYLIDHPEIDDPAEIERVQVNLRGGS